MKGLKKYSAIFVTVMTGLCIRMEVARADILAVLFENGSDFVELKDSIVYPLFCEGQVDPCGEETDFTPTHFQLDANGGEIILDVKVCLGDSCVTARNALFIANAIPEIVQPIGMSYSTVMTEHDPIACEDATGIFAQAGCSGILDLNYRCLNAFDFLSGSLVKTLAGSFIISTLK